jgi:hypothetical protein
MRRAVFPTLAVLLALALTAAAPAAAHWDAAARVDSGAPTHASPATLAADSPAASTTSAPALFSAARNSAPGALWWVAVVCLGAALSLVARWRRQAVGLALVAILSLFAFESAVHSVHHLAERGDATCVVASVSSHDAAVVIDVTAVRPLAPVELRAAVVVRPVLSRIARAPVAARAPPFVAS